MTQTQQVDALGIVTGGDLNGTLAWATLGQPSGIVGNGYFIFPNPSLSTSNGIQGVYTKDLPSNSVTPEYTAEDIPRAIANGYGVLPETACQVGVRGRVSIAGGSTTTWNTAFELSDLMFGVILRASGTTWGVESWYELGIRAMQSPTSGTIVLRRVNAGVTTLFQTTTFASLGLVFPKYNAAGTGTWPVNHNFILLGSATNIAGNVFLSLTLGYLDGPAGPGTQPGASWTVNFLDSAAGRITTAGFGGFYASGRVDGVKYTAGARGWWHLTDWLLTADFTPTIDPNPPADVDTQPALVTPPTLTNIAVAGEGSASGTLPYEPDVVAPTETGWLTNKGMSDAGYVTTHPRFASGRRSWALEWKNRATADQTTLQAFFISHSGPLTAFSWTPPDLGAPVKVYFTNVVHALAQPTLTTKDVRAVLMELF